MPAPPPRPLPPEKIPRRSSWLSIFLAMLLLLIVGLVLLVLSLGQLLPVLVIGGLIFLVTGFHYLVWGWWLGRMIEREAENEEA
ncbi:MAG: hypothetical protein KY475_13900 [Planctomycetes bacterium]|nr:hypothetical protein [Planctomycetota bacterium]